VRRVRRSRHQRDFARQRNAKTLQHDEEKQNRVSVELEEAS
jgi:hypothetical protein